MNGLVAFRAAGLPIPQGHIRTVTRGGHTWSFHGSPGLAGWRATVAAAAQAAYTGSPTPEAVQVAITFLMPRPRAHYVKAGLRPTAPARPTTRPDIDRLARAILDAITGVVIADDAQVVSLEAGKAYCDPGAEGAYVTIAPLGVG